MNQNKSDTNVVMLAEAQGRPESPVAASRRPSTLVRIAELLGCSVKDLREGLTERGDARDTAELLRLWFAIHDPEHRRKVLDYTRALADPARGDAEGSR